MCKEDKVVWSIGGTAIAVVIAFFTWAICMNINGTNEAKRCGLKNMSYTTYESTHKWYNKDTETFSYYKQIALERESSEETVIKEATPFWWEQ